VFSVNLLLPPMTTAWAAIKYVSLFSHLPRPDLIPFHILIHIVTTFERQSVACVAFYKYQRMQLLGISTIHWIQGFSYLIFPLESRCAIGSSIVDHYSSIRALF